jgi:hypothetical protein
MAEASNVGTVGINFMVLWQYVLHIEQHWLNIVS